MAATYDGDSMPPETTLRRDEFMRKVGRGAYPAMTSGTYVGCIDGRADGL
jgi:hypothetical protein